MMIMVFKEEYLTLLHREIAGKITPRSFQLRIQPPHFLHSNYRVVALCRARTTYHILIRLGDYFQIGFSKMLNFSLPFLLVLMGLGCLKENILKCKIIDLWGFMYPLCADGTSNIPKGFSYFFFFQATKLSDE